MDCTNNFEYETSASIHKILFQICRVLETRNIQKITIFIICRRRYAILEALCSVANKNPRITFVLSYNWHYETDFESNFIFFYV